MRSRRLLTALGAAGLLGVAACGSGDEAGAPAADPTSETSPETAESSSARTEVTGPRLAITYDGGVQVLDQDTLEVVEDFPMEGFLRLNPAGDLRHLLVSTGEGFQVLDTGVAAEGHGDHYHFYDSGAELLDLVHPAPEPGHAIVHADHLALWSDGTGEVQILDPEQVTADVGAPEWTAPEAHHGLAVPLSDGGLLVSVGNADERTGAAVLDESLTEVASIDSCPGIHGETTAANGAVVVGCEDGVVMWADGELTKIDAPDDYGRIGNQAGSRHSDVVLGDYKTDPDAEREQPTQVALIDTDTAELTLVDLPASYTFRSLARGPEGEALVLGDDGNLHVIDPDTGELTDSIPVVEPWSEPIQWQQPRPTIEVQGSVAWVTEPATSEVHVIFLPDGEVVDTVALDVVPNEISSVGELVEPGHDHSEEGHDHSEEGHDHSEEGHDHSDEDGHGGE